MIGQTEILVIAAVILLLFGATAIPKLARSLGKAKKEFQEGMKDGSSDNDTQDNTADHQDEETK